MTRSRPYPLEAAAVADFEAFGLGRSGFLEGQRQVIRAGLVGLVEEGRGDAVTGAVADFTAGEEAVAVGEAGVEFGGLAAEFGEGFDVDGELEGRADAGGADQEVGDGRLHHLPRGREEAQDAQAASLSRP